MEKQRKPLSEESLAKLAAARELANKKRKELSEQRKVEKESIIQQKMEEAKQKKQDKLEKSAAKEVKKRLQVSDEVEEKPVSAEPVATEPVATEPVATVRKPKKKDTVVVEYSSSDSDDFDFEDARVLFVKKEKQRNSSPQVEKQQVPPVQRDPLASAYRNMFGPRLF